ncbi:MAG: iron-sulfur cluster assembly accessory protein [Halobacteria archaeon]|nr:iron-sulfur cluster assembly accessory protein [Halobacteria archaeon]
MSKDGIEITQEAAEKVEELREERGLEGYGISVGVGYGGGEATYTLEFSESPEPSDEVVESRGIEVYVDEESAAAVEGAKIDFVVKQGEKGFRVVPPNQTGEREYEDSLEGRVREFHDTNFPQIRGHGGEAVIEKLDENEGYVKLSLEGACSGCGISDATSKAIRERMPQSLRGIEEVEISAGDDDHMEIDPPV